MQHNKSLLEFYLDDIDQVNEALTEGLSWDDKVAEADKLLAEICNKLSVYADDTDGYWQSEDTWCNRNLYYINNFDIDDKNLLEKLIDEYNKKLEGCEFYYYEDEDTDEEDDPVSEIGYILEDISVVGESLTEDKKKKKPYSSITYTTGDIAHNLRQFNKRMGTDFPGNDNNNPSTEEAKAAAQAANGEISGSAGEVSGASGEVSGSNSATSGASAGGACAESLEEGIVFSDKAQRVQIKDLLGTEDEYILNRLQAGRDGGDAMGFGSTPHRLSKEDLNLLKDEWIYIEDDGECWWACFEKPVAEIRKLLGLDENLKEDFDDEIQYDEEGNELFTPEEQEEYECDEWGYSNDGYDQYHHCGWCKEIYPESDMRQEADFGWLCDRCQDELHYHGGPLMFIECKENEALDNKVCITFECPECGYEWDETFEKDYFEDEDDLDDVMNNSTNECPECGCEDCFAKSSEYLTEDTLYPSKKDNFGDAIELPAEVKLIDSKKVLEVLNKLEPEEEFTVGYITPVFFYKNLIDKFQLLKCTELKGTTGIDYIEARVGDDANKQARLDIANKTKDLGQNKGVHLDRWPNAKQVGDFSAQYSVNNKVVVQPNGETILFYPVVGQRPKVRYYLRTYNANTVTWTDWTLVKREFLEDTIIRYVTSIKDKLVVFNKNGKAAASRWEIADLRKKIEKQLEIDTKTIEAVTIDAEDRWETRSRLSNGNVAKPQVRALYINQVFYLEANNQYWGVDILMNESLNKNNKPLTEAKRYVRRYFVRPQQIFCSNKSEILKTLIELGDENCSVYTLNNLGDVKDVTKLTNDDIIYYYDDGILYDKNHVKVMDYDLSIKHEEDRKKYSTEPTTSELAGDEYDDRMTKATVVEYYDGNNENVDPQSTVKPSKEVPIVDCKKYDVVTHSEDEKPLDCKMEKKPLEKPLTEEADEFVELTDEDFEESLTEAKKDEDELPPDPEVVKLETHQELNDLVAGEISTINDYEEVKADIIEKPVEHKDDIIDTINHIEDEEKEHIDELSKTVSEIPFGGSHKEAAPAPVVEAEPEEEFVELTDEDLEEDFDEEAPEAEDKYFACIIDDIGVIGYVKAKDEMEAYAKMEDIWPEYCYSNYDGYATVEEATAEEVEENELYESVDISNVDNEFDLAFESYNVYGEKLTEAKNDKFTCCICGEESYGYGNNPYPVKDDGRCCDSCNAKFVIPARIEAMHNKKDE